VQGGQREVVVGVDEAGQQGAAGQVDDGGVRPARKQGVVTRGHDPIAVDDEQFRFPDRRVHGQDPAAAEGVDTHGRASNIRLKGCRRPGGTG
jgi:hypothetical protein